MMQLTKAIWGHHEGQNVYLFKLSNGQMEVSLTNFGATIAGIITPDKNGQKQNIVLGYDDLAGYIADEFYIGCTVGRFAGRIAGAALNINGVQYPLAPNDGDKNIHLHGGNKGFNKRVFTVTNEAITDDTASVELYYRSPHLEEGYPGNLDIWIMYQLSADNKLSIRYKAVSDADTHINLTNHSYFNLSGKQQNALNHRLFINADSYLVSDENYIPTGEVKSVVGTSFDFKTDRVVDNGSRNECYVLTKNTVGLAAILSHEASGREMRVETDMPALVFYSADYLDGQFLKNGGLCLETQYYPDSPNHATFPSTLLKAGEIWEQWTELGFGW
ncbi:galactose mutarotase [Mucilaginibacter mali]|uniref:Aldose 1-epimerase n=1 Tax=Mucilaginibacter mali TaxID=2740462 RepID=A0A7D4TNS6_9SPHI|nr:aldose epimerase family protein [Mucilaginibacter mali]QKJ31253.1 galactose mutarotase [Mucilaginibacter mali]